MKAARLMLIPLHTDTGYSSVEGKGGWTWTWTSSLPRKLAVHDVQQGGTDNNVARCTRDKGLI